MFQRYSKLLDYIEKFIKILIIFLLSTAFLVVLAQVIFRYFFGQGYPWIEEYARYAIIWLSMLGAVVALRHSKELKLDIFEDALNSKAIKFLKFAFNLLMIIFFTIMIKSGYMYLIENGTNISAGLPIKMGYVYLSVPVGMFFLIIYTIEKVWDDIIAMKSHSKKSANKKLENGEVNLI